MGGKGKPQLMLVEHGYVAFYPEIATHFGLFGALLLQQIHFWLSTSNNAKVYEGRLWTYNSFDKWALQLGCCVRTVKAAVKRMQEEGVLLTGRFNKAGFDRTTWYTIDYLRLAELTGLPHSEFYALSSGKDLHYPSCKSCTMDGAEFAPPIPKSSTKSSIKKNSASGKPEAKNILPDVIGENNQQGLESGEQQVKMGSNVSEVLGNIGATGKGGKIAHQPTPKKDLYSIWKQNVRLHYDQVVVDVPTGKDVGQLKRLRTVAGPDFEPLVAYIVQPHAWERLGNWVKLHYGVSHPPKSPDIGFVVKYAGAALSLWADKNAPEAHTPQKLNLSTESSPKPKKEEAEKLPTFEEAQKILNGEAP